MALANPKRIYTAPDDKLRREVEREAKNEVRGGVSMTRMVTILVQEALEARKATRRAMAHQES